MDEFSKKNKIHYSNISNVQSHTFICGFCNKTIAPNQGYKITYETSSMGRIETRVGGYVYECPNCKKPTFYNLVDNKIYPSGSYGKEVKGLPPLINILYGECRINYSNGCYTSSVLMARKLLMNIAVEQGADENKSFQYYVNYLDEKGYIPPNGKDWVDFIRSQGNEATHELIVREDVDAKKVLDFLASLLLFIYELPAVLKE